VLNAHDSTSTRGNHNNNNDVNSGVAAREPVDLTDAAAALIIAGRDLVREGDLVGAEATYREALEHVALMDNTSDAVIVLLARIGNVCYAQHKWDKALDAFSASVRGLVHAAGKSPDDPAVVEISLKIAGTQRTVRAHVP